MTTLLTADHVIAHDGSGFVELRDGAVLVDGPTIAFVGPRAQAPDDATERIDLGQSVLMPGLIDLDALADIDHLQLDSWGTGAGGRLAWSADYFAHRRHEVLTAQERRTMRRFALAQLALHGITTFMPIASEVHAAWAETFDDLMDVARIAQRIGLRGFLGPSYRSGVHTTDADGAPGIGWDDAEGETAFADAVRFLDAVDELDDPRLTGVLVPCRIETVREDVLRRTAEISAARGVLVRLHALQGLRDAADTRASSGVSELELIERVGLLTDRTLIAHGVYIDVHPALGGADRGDLATLANAGVSVIHCPLTNIRYASNLEKLSQYLDAGVNIALGTDSFPPDLVRGIDQGVQLSKSQHHDLSRGLLAEYIQAGTLGGARALHRPDLGRIAVGATADLVAFALDDFRMGAVEDPLRTLVLAGSGRDCRFSMVDGRVVERDGGIAGIDLEELRREGQRIFDRLREAYGERDHRGGIAAELFPPVFPAAH